MDGLDVSMLDVLPDTCARSTTFSLRSGVLFDGVTMTDGGCAGSTVTLLETDSLDPPVSTAVAVTVNVPAS